MNRQTMIALFAGAAIGGAATAATVAWAEPKGAATAPVTGALMPLDTLIAEIERKHGGRVTDIELERRPWGDHYEMELTDRNFHEWDIVVDARTGHLVRESRDFD